MVNLNNLAKTVVLREGKKVSLSIGQCKEVMRILLEELAKEDLTVVERVLRRYKKKRRR